VPSDKGDAVRRVVTDSGARAVLVAGDDLGDLPAFVAASRLGEALRVAVLSAETPAPLLDAADVVVESPQGLLDLLRRWPVGCQNSAIAFDQRLQAAGSSR
jgi:trehalose 6-phosphate phosphatase